MNKKFNKIASTISNLYGRSYTFIIAVIMILVWAAFGAPLKFSDTWHLLINTPTTIITFLGVFMIQNSQNREMRAVQVKLDLLLRANKIDDKQWVELEDKTDVEVEKVHKAVQKGTK